MPYEVKLTGELRNEFGQFKAIPDGSINNYGLITAGNFISHVAHIDIVWIKSI